MFCFVSFRFSCRQTLTCAKTRLFFPTASFDQALLFVAYQHWVHTIRTKLRFCKPYLPKRRGNRQNKTQGNVILLNQRPHTQIQLIWTKFKKWAKKAPLVGFTRPFKWLTWDGWFLLKWSGYSSDILTVQIKIQFYKYPVLAHASISHWWAKLNSTILLCFVWMKTQHLSVKT